MTHASSILLVLLCSLLVACGGGATAASGPGSVTYPLPDGPGDFPVGDEPGGGSGPQPTDSLHGGVLLTLDSAGEVWTWWVTNPDTAQGLVDIWNGTRTAFSFGGVLRGGPGEADHNSPWSWHVDPLQNGIDGLTVPESPKTPSQCENQLAYWLAEGVVFLPPNTTIRSLEDRR